VRDSRLVPTSNVTSNSAENPFDLREHLSSANDAISHRGGIKQKLMAVAWQDLQVAAFRGVGSKGDLCSNIMVAIQFT
jgi:hypothetical protein